MTSHDMGNALLPDVARSVVFQNYRPGPRVDGVFQVRLDKHQALEGWFMELFRITGGRLEWPSPPGGPPFEVRQVSLSLAVPGRINAFHLHPKRVHDEVWCVVRGTLLAWLVDVRKGSASAGVKQKLVLSGEEPSLLYIPAGVAHGFKAGPDGALLLYAMNAQFDPEDPNEGRLPWDYFGKELWADDRG